MLTGIVDPLTDGRWMEFIASQKQATVHHHPAWLRVIGRETKLNPQAFCRFDDGKIISAFVFIIAKSITGNRYAVTVSCSDSTLILGDQHNSDELLPAFLEYMKQLGVQQIEFRDNISSELIAPVLVAYAHFFYVDEVIEAIKNSATLRKVKYNIRRAEKEGVTFEIRDDLNAVHEFYKLHVKTRKKLGVPVQSKKFYIRFYEEIVRTGRGYIVCAKRNNIPLSVGLFAGYNNTLTFQISASDPRALFYRPNNMMLWGAMQEAQNRGYTKFDMGRTDCTNEGLRKFKLSWGCEEISLYFSYYPPRDQKELLRNLNRLIVNPVIRHSPEFVCRAAGRLVYTLFPLQFI